MELRVTYDKSVDTAYLYLSTSQETVVREVEAVPETIILGFDSEDRLVGIEVLGARKTLPTGFCDQAEQLS